MSKLEKQQDNYIEQMALLKYFNPLFIFNSN